MACYPIMTPGTWRRGFFVAGFMSLLCLSAPAFGACEEIARVPLLPQPSATAEGDTVGVICSWRTGERWAPSEECGNVGFEIVGWGDMPGAVEFKRTNTYYTTEWETQALEPGGAEEPTAWSTKTLQQEASANRCAVGWCEPVNYALRTLAAVPDAVCDQKVELRVRMTDQAE